LHGCYICFAQFSSGDTKYKLEMKLGMQRNLNLQLILVAKMKLKKQKRKQVHFEITKEHKEKNLS